MGLKQLVNRGAKAYSKLIVKAGKINYAREYRKLPPAEGEREWKKRWIKLQRGPSINCYRKYAALVDEPLNIIPMDLMNTVIQPILNPNRIRPYYSDKNLFDRIFGEVNMPTTILRRIQREYFNSQYRHVESFDLTLPNSSITELIAKPSVDSYSGKRVLLFKRSQDGTFRWNENEDKLLSIDLLDELLGENWILQEKMKQHSFMAGFNNSSVNTFRVHIYRSPVSGETHVAAMCMRVGAQGNWYDNIHGGGFCVGVDLATGELGRLAADGKGNVTNDTHGLDFSKKIIVPNFRQLKEFAIEMGEKVIHHHSLAMDIMMNEDGTFRLIEVNIGTFDANMYSATGSTPFGKYTEEVYQYCLENLDRVNLVHVIPW